MGICACDMAMFGITPKGVCWGIWPGMAVATWGGVGVALASGGSDCTAGGSSTTASSAEQETMQVT